MVETEVKIRWDGAAEAAQALIERQGYQVIGSRTLEVDQLFDRRSAELRQSDQLLRLRSTLSSDGAATATVTYKGPATREVYKSREEIEFEVSDAGAFALVLDRLGYSAGFRYEKYRTKFGVPDDAGVITVDETPIGVYLELEGPRDWIDAAAQRLGLPPEAYLTDSYASLYREFCEKNPNAPKDMIFRLQDRDNSSAKQP
jgi:adenylate cyclase class 2